MSKILQTNPKSVQTHKDLIMQCLDDKDESIRLRALNLLYGMVSKKTLMEIIKKLLTHMNKAEGSHYRDQLLCKIIDICCQNNYQYITNFEWYISVLVELTRMDHVKHGKLISSQILDVTIRVESIREFSVKQMCILLENMDLFSSNNNEINEVLYAAAWICGEFSNYIQKPSNLVDSMLKTKIHTLSPHIQSIFLHNIFKLYSVQINYYFLNDNDTSRIVFTKELTTSLLNKLNQFEHNSDLEVQERACMIIQLLKYVLKTIDKIETESDLVEIFKEINYLFEGELNPVAVKAQIKVPIPEGLDLDIWINDPPSESESEDVNEQQIFIKEQKVGNQYNIMLEKSNTRHVQNEEDYKKIREARQIEMEINPYYIKSNKKRKTAESIQLTNSLAQHVINNNEKTNTNMASFNIPGIISSDSYYRMNKIDHENKKLKKKMSKKKKHSERKTDRIGSDDDNDDEEDKNSSKNLVTITGNEMPEGARESDEEYDKKFKINSGLYDNLNINLDK